jgi:hypothetical protein
VNPLILVTFPKETVAAIAKIISIHRPARSSRSCRVDRRDPERYPESCLCLKNVGNGRCPYDSVSSGHPMTNLRDSRKLLSQNIIGISSCNYVRLNFPWRFASIFCSLVPLSSVIYIST